MSEFQQAIETVHDTLRELQARGSRLRTPRAALEKLRAAQAAEAVVPVVAVPQVKKRIAPEDRPPARNVFVSADEPDISTRVTAPPSSASSSKADRLAAIRGPILACTKCPHLVRSRTQVVFGVGNPEAELMFVGEAPGEDEDRKGEPFVGRAGELLTKMIVAMGFTRDDVYIGNVLKCRPDMPPGESGNRKPKPSEMETCLPYLREQIEIIQPRVLVALGATAMEGLIGEVSPMGKLRGRWHEFGGTPLMATYHPAYLLRNQSNTEKRKVWEDLLLVLEKLGRPISAKQRGFFLPKPEA